MQAGPANGAAHAQLPLPPQQPANGGAARQGGTAAAALEDNVIKVKSDEEEEGATGLLLPDSSMDARLAQQMASELERGAYAQVPRWSACSPRPALCPTPARTDARTAGLQDMAAHLDAGDAAAAGELMSSAVAAITADLPQGLKEVRGIAARTTPLHVPRAVLRIACLGLQEDEDEDEDEEEEGGSAFDNVLVPGGGVQLDAAVMSTLPPSMQLDLLQRMRDHKIFENREHFQQRAQQPGSFSSFQIQEYLKASAFRCERTAWAPRPWLPLA